MGIRISEMEEATTFGANDVVPIVSSGSNKKITGTKIKNFVVNNTPIVISDEADSIDCPYRIHTTVCDVTITPGTWIIFYHSSFGTGSLTGSRRMYLTNSSTSTTIRYTSRITARAADLATDITGAVAVTVDANTGIYLRAYQQNDDNSATVTVSGFIQAIKIIGS